MKRSPKRFALCFDNAGDDVSLIPGKIYIALPDARAEKDGLVRIVDETGEDYLFDGDQFAFVDLPLPIRRRILALQQAG